MGRVRLLGLVGRLVNRAWCRLVDARVVTPLVELLPQRRA
jgi:hypothetical protein